jgi:hypothetical protein
MIIDSPIISGSYAATGSLNQVGNVTITGSLTVTGPIIGALTGSVDSASFATTASYVSPNTQINTASFAITASYVSPNTQITSASFATTASYASTVDYNNTVVTSSFAVTASYVSPNTQINTASFAITASYVSPNTQINSASFATTASYALTSSYADTASYSVSSSYSLTASYADTASYVATASSALTSSFLKGQEIYVNDIYPTTGNSQNRIFTENVNSGFGGIGDTVIYTSISDINLYAGAGTRAVKVTGSLDVTNGITGSLSGTASYSANSNLLDGLDSSVFTPTGSFNEFSSSILSYTSSTDNRLGSLETASGSAINRLNAIENKTGSYATTGSNTFVGGQYFSSSFNPTGFTTTASLYTDGGLRVTRDAYISGTLYLNNVTVFGTQSVAYISSSQLNIGTNIITVNTDTPSVRFGGLAVYDSGSTSLTGSILWDSQDNQWIYSNPSGSTYDSAMFLVGPRNSGVLGNESGINCNFLSKGNGMHHMTSSGIFEDGSRTCFYGTSFISSSGTACFASSITSLSNNFITTTNAYTTQGTVSYNDTRGLILRAKTGTVYDYAVYSAAESAMIVNPTGTNTISFLSGDVGIGTASPSHLLHARKDQNSYTWARIENQADNSSAYAGLQLGAYGNSWGLAIGSSLANGNSLNFLIDAGGANTSKLTLFATGIACFASTICSPTLVINNQTNISPDANGTGQLMIQGNGYQGYTALDATAMYIGHNSQIRNLTFQTNETNRLTINGDGISCFACQICAPQICSTYIGASCYLEGVLKAGVRGCFVTSIAAIPHIYYSERFPNDASGTFPFNQYGELIFQGGTRVGYNAGFSFVTGTADTGTATVSVKARIFESGVACFACTVCAPTAIIAGAVGIGVTSPTQCLEVSGIIKSSGASNSIMFTNRNCSTATWEWYSQGTPGSGFAGLYKNHNTSGTPLVVSDNGNVGIGCISPGAQLVVYGACNGDTTLHVQNGSVSGKISFSNNTANAIYGGGWWGYMGYSSATYHLFGQCIVTPKLHIGTPDGCGLILQYGANSGYAGISTDAANNLIFKAYIGTEYMRIRCDGNVGIGTTSPNETLDVNGTIQVRGSSLGYATTQCVGMLDFYASATRLLSFGGNSTTCGCFRFYSAGQNNNGGSDVATISGGGVACFRGAVCAPRLFLTNNSTAAVLSITNADSTNDAGVRGLAIITDRLRFGVSPVTSTYGAIATNGTNSGITFVTYDNSWSERLRIECTGIVNFYCQICVPKTITNGTALFRTEIPTQGYFFSIQQNIGGCGLSAQAGGDYVHIKTNITKDDRMVGFNVRGYMYAPDPVDTDIAFYTYSPVSYVYSVSIYEKSYTGWNYCLYYSGDNKVVLVVQGSGTYGGFVLTGINTARYNQMGEMCILGVAHATCWCAQF